MRYFFDPAHWRGESGIPNRIAEHLHLSGVSILLAVLLAVPLALWLGHVGRGGFLAINTANVGRAIPSLALLGFFASLLPRGYASIWPSILALVALAVPPMVTNTYVGVREVDRDVVEAARGMGLSGAQLLGRVELPLAMPLILAGVRTATTNVIATAPLAALLGQGGLGRYILDGQDLGDEPRMVAGAVLVALLALAADALITLAARWLGPGAGPRRATHAGAATPVEQHLPTGLAVPDVVGART